MDTLQKNTRRVLRWSEKYTKTDMVYLASGGFWLFLKTGLTMLIAFAVSVAFANLLPQSTYGEYKYIFSIFSFLALPTLLGMGTAVTKSIAQGYDGTTEEALRTKIRWGLLGSAGSVCVALYYFLNGNIRLAEAFVIVAAFLPFMDSLGIFNSILTGKKLFRISTIYEVIIQAAAAAVMILTLFLTDNLLIILAAYFFAYTSVRFVIFREVIHRYRENNSVDAGAIGYGKHLSVMEILSTAAGTAESVLLWQFVGPTQLAIYAFAKAIPSQMSAALQRINTLAFPKFAQSDFQSIKKPLMYKMLKMTVLMAVIVIAYIVIAPFIFQILFPKYTDSILYTQIYVLILLFFPQKFIGTLFQAHAHTKALYISTTVVPLVRLLFLLLLIPPFGILGAIYAELLSRAVSLVIVSALYITANK